MAGTGNKKSSKKDQPKRKRYNMEQRGINRRKADFLRHCNENPNDKQAQEIARKDRHEGR